MWPIPHTRTVDQLRRRLNSLFELGQVGPSRKIAAEDLDTVNAPFAGAILTVNSEGKLAWDAPPGDPVE